MHSALLARNTFWYGQRIEYCYLISPFNYVLRVPTSLNTFFKIRFFFTATATATATTSSRSGPSTNIFLMYYIIFVLYYDVLKTAKTHRVACP